MHDLNGDWMDLILGVALWVSGVVYFLLWGVR